MLHNLTFCGTYMYWIMDSQCNDSDNKENNDLNKIDVGIRTNKHQGICSMNN